MIINLNLKWSPEITGYFPVNKTVIRGMSTGKHTRKEHNNKSETIF